MAEITVTVNAKKRVNVKMMTFAALNRIVSEGSDYHKSLLADFMVGKYDAATKLAMSLQAQVFELNGSQLVVNLIGNYSIERVDTIRRYAMQWRRLQKSKNEAAA